MEVVIGILGVIHLLLSLILSRVAIIIIPIIIAHVPMFFILVALLVIYGIFVFLLIGLLFLVEVPVVIIGIFKEIGFLFILFILYDGSRFFIFCLLFILWLFWWCGRPSRRCPESTRP